MDAMILAGGYGTRLYPLTLDKPKPLIDVSGKLIVEHIINKLEDSEEINKIYIITNEKFAENFSEWLKGYNTKKPIEIINDGTTSNENRLGAIGDINFTVNIKGITDDTIVIAGDNLFDLSLKEVIARFKQNENNTIVLYDVKDLELASKYGVVSVTDNIVTSFEEKPKVPKSTLISTGIYIFPKKSLKLIKKYIDQKNDPDKSGSLIEWLYKRENVYAYITDESWYDIGSMDQLEKARKHYKD